MWYLLSCTRSSIRLLLEFSKCGGAAAGCNETKFHKGCILQFLTIAKERYISHWVGESCAIKRDKTSRAGIPGLKQRSGTLNFTYSPAKPLNFYSYLTSLDRRIISCIFYKWPALKWITSQSGNGFVSPLKMDLFPGRECARMHWERNFPGNLCIV